MSWLSKGRLGRTWYERQRRKFQAAEDFEDFLLVTWDSCRFDAYQQARTPVLDRYASAKRGWAMATYTLPAHQAMFCGFLPHVFESEPFYNRYVQQLWRISHRNVHVKPLVTFPEGTDNIVRGFRQRGYATLGVAAMDWFASPSTLQDGFDWFRVTGTRAREQNEMLIGQIGRRAAGGPCFAFVNYGETHSPFRHEGMGALDDPVAKKVSLSRLFNQQGVHNGGQLDPQLFQRQVECAEYLDGQMAELIDFFIRRGRPTTVIVCADHGECLGEQGLYGHAFYHEKVMEVPILIFRLNALPHAVPELSVVARRAAS
ncbi:MAG: sulfatase-like hydrolase/transferase [Planctomycetes bacterium]|nr:sulfatase-like hydrolase/transferase [Planctomycetota bacterium]